MENIWIPVGVANTKKELKKILNDKRLKDVETKILDVFNGTSDKAYWKHKIKHGLDHRFSVNVKPDYWK